jgi:hypothetical protein
VSIITGSRPAARQQVVGRPLVVVLSDGHRQSRGVGSAVLRQLDGRGVDVTLIGCDAEESALLDAWRNRGLVIVVDPMRAEPGRPGRIHRLVLPRPGSGRLILLAVEASDTDDAADTARQVADAITAESGLAHDQPLDRVLLVDRDELVDHRAAQVPLHGVG